MTLTVVSGDDCFSLVRNASTVYDVSRSEIHHAMGCPALIAYYTHEQFLQYMYVYMYMYFIPWP